MAPPKRGRNNAVDGVDKPPKTARIVYTWSDDAHLAYLDVLRDSIGRGERTDTGFKPSVAAHAIEAFRDKGLPIPTAQQLTNKRDTVRD